MPGKCKYSLLDKRLDIFLKTAKHFVNVIQFAYSSSSSGISSSEEGENQSGCHDNISSLSESLVSSEE